MVVLDLLLLLVLMGEAAVGLSALFSLVFSLGLLDVLSCFLPACWLLLALPDFVEAAEEGFTLLWEASLETGDFSLLSRADDAVAVATSSTAKQQHKNFLRCINGKFLPESTNDYLI